MGVDGVSVSDKPFLVVWQLIRHFVGWSLCLGGEGPLMSRAVCWSIPAGLVRARDLCRAPPSPRPLDFVRGEGSSSVHRLRPNIAIPCLLRGHDTDASVVSSLSSLSGASVVLVS